MPILKSARYSTAPAPFAERLGETPQRFAMMWGNYAFHVVRGDFRLCADLAQEAMEFAERLNDPGILMEALFLAG